MQHSIVRNSWFSRSAFSVFCLVAISGCAGLQTTNMVPDNDTARSLQTGKSIRAVEVRGEQESVWGGSLNATKEQIHAAVVETLTRSGSFGSVDSGAGDLNLEVVVRSQGQDVGALLQYTGTMTVTYRFTDTAGKAIWSTTLESSGSSRAFAGATRTTEARERTVKANLTAFLDELNKSWK